MRKTGAKRGATPPAGLRVIEPRKVKLADINFAEYNPRTMPPAKMRSLKASLVKHGVVLNLVLQLRSDAGVPNVLIGGHQRTTAVRELCEERGWPPVDEAWCTVLDVRDAEAKQLNVALNNTEGEFDPYKLGELFKEIHPEMTSDDVLATGFSDEEVRQAIALTAGDADLEVVGAAEREAARLPGFGSSVTLSVEFGTVADRDAAKAMLRGAVDARGGKPGTVVLAALRAARAAGKLGARGRK